MFGALVLGGGILVQPGCAGADPVQKKPAPDPSAEQPAPVQPAVPPAQPTSAPTADTAAANPDNAYCQIELTLHKYKRDGVVESVKSCMDGKTNAEVLEALEAAKKQTCGTPFCGCWLG